MCEMIINVVRKFNLCQKVMGFRTHMFSPHFYKCNTTHPPTKPPPWPCLWRMLDKIRSLNKFYEFSIIFNSRKYCAFKYTCFLINLIYLLYSWTLLRFSMIFLMVPTTMQLVSLPCLPPHRLSVVWRERLVL